VEPNAERLPRSGMRHSWAA